FILDDSNQPKDTIGVLQHARKKRLEIANEIQIHDPDFNWHGAKERPPAYLNFESNVLYYGTIRNRDILHEAMQIIDAPDFDPPGFGKLLTEHHTILSKSLLVSTGLIDSMLDK